jgi:AraC family transcriptional activator of pobA
MDATAQNLYFSNMHSKSLNPRTSGPRAPVPAFFLYGEPPQPPDESTVHIETIAARSRLHNWNIHPHRHRDLHQLLVLQSGGVVAQVDDQTITAAAPCAVIVPPNVVHAFSFEIDTVGLVASFAAGLARDVIGRSAALRQFLGEPGFIVLSKRTLRATDISTLATMVLLEFGRSAGGREVALRGLLAALVANLYRVGLRTAGHHSDSGARDRGLVAKFREAIEGRFMAHASVGDYCRDLGVSESQLRRACLRVADQAPVALIHFRMIVEAERQLRYTSMPVAQVAYLLGFEDPAYFTRFFRQRSGLSPKAFRARSN